MLFRTYVQIKHFPAASVPKPIELHRHRQLQRQMNLRQNLISDHLEMFDIALQKISVFMCTISEHSIQLIQ